jgi:hypothetical protein
MVNKILGCVRLNTDYHLCTVQAYVPACYAADCDGTLPSAFVWSIYIFDTAL